MPVKRCLIKEAVIFNTDGIDESMNHSDDDKNAILPVDTGTVGFIANVNNRGNKLSKAKISRSNGDYIKITLLLYIQLV